MDPPTKKTKKRNFSDRETEVLLEEVGLEYTLLISQLQNAVTVKRKREIWHRIADKVNAIGGCNRDWEACKKRWKDLKAAYYKKPRLDTGTGGGKPTPPVPYEDIIRQIVSDSNLSDGIEGGGDTFTSIVVGEEMTQNDTSASSGQEDTQGPQAEIIIIEPAYTSSAIFEIGNAISSHIPSTSSANVETRRVISSNKGLPSTSENVQTPRVISSQMKRKMKKRQMEFTSQRNPVVPVERQDSESELKKQFLSSEIEKNRLKIELYKVKIERNKIGKEVDELMKHKLQLEIERLQKVCEKDK